jgi:hypothetical protein
MSNPTGSTNLETPTLNVRGMQFASGQSKVAWHLKHEPGVTGDGANGALTLAGADLGIAIAPTPAPTPQTS